MCMYFTKGINQNGYMLCLHCNMKKDNHYVFKYIYNITSQCDDIVLLIQDYIKSDTQTIARGKEHTITLLEDNTIKCWGNNMYGQCNVPDSIQGKVVSVKCGTYHTIALLNDNTIKCWGRKYFEECNILDSIQKKIMDTVY